VGVKEDIHRHQMVPKGFDLLGINQDVTKVGYQDTG
jgi:hypothetical protein